eukprot:3457455-Rhodomonas_salina.1
MSEQLKEAESERVALLAEAPATRSPVLTDITTSTRYCRITTAGNDVVLLVVSSPSNPSKS